MAGTKGIFLTASSANKRTYRAVYASRVKSRVVPRACAVLKSGPYKGKLRKGCRFVGRRAFCDVIIADKLRCDAKAAKKAVRKTARKAAKKHRVRHAMPKTLVAPKRKHRRARKALPSGSRTRRPRLEYREGRGYVVRGL
jgi:hypothetical protein